MNNAYLTIFSPEGALKHTGNLRKYSFCNAASGKIMISYIYNIILYTDNKMTGTWV